MTFVKEGILPKARLRYTLDPVMKRLATVLILSLGLQAPAAAGELPAIPEIEKNLQLVWEKIAPAVVHIASKADLARGSDTTRPDLPTAYQHYYSTDPQNAPEELGSGVIVDPAGLILTNRHVVEGLKEIRIRMHDGRDLTGEVVGYSDILDLAVLRVPQAELPHAELGDLSRIHPGTMVLAFGSPFGFERSMTFGIVSALRDEKDAQVGVKRFIQTDAAINPGNSGGPLVDLQGRVIGINTALYTQGGGSEGVGFALPVDDVRREMERILGRQPRPGWLGVTTLPMANGLELTAVLAGGPAQQAGLVPGDVLLTLAAQTLATREDLVAVLEQHHRGERLELEILRAGERKKIEVLLGEKEVTKDP